MPVANFPPIELADEHGLLAIGGDFSVETLVLAYQRGIFPWPISDQYPLAWFSPDPRGIIEWDRVYLSQSLRKFLKKQNYKIIFNRDFESVIKGCGTIQRKGQTSTWITKDIVQGYKHLFQKELAYCVEVLSNDKLVAGLYGVCINGIVSGESMFHKESNTSKLALLAVLYSLHINGLQWLDTQMVTPVVDNLGGREIPREIFIEKMERLQKYKRHELFGVLPKDWTLHLLQELD